MQRGGDRVETGAVALGAHLAVGLAIAPAHHAKADLALAHDDFVGAEIVEVAHLLIRMRPRDDLQVRIEPARLLDRLPGLERIGDGDQQRRGAGDIGECQRLPARRIADHHLDAGGVRRSDTLLGILDEDERRALPRETVGDHRADAAIADQHGVMRERGRRALVGGIDRWRRHGRRSGKVRLDALRHDDRRVGGEARFELRPDMFRQLDQQRIEHDRDDRAGQDVALAFGRHQPEADAERRENEGEFADLRQ